MIELSQDTVRAVMIAAQGLQQTETRATKKDVQRIIRQMHVLQIDTISVVARSPYLVLWSRLGDYQQRWLDELLAEGKLFEYWSHAACFLPIEDYGLYRRVMLDKRIWNENNWRKWLNDHDELVKGMLAHIRENGAVRSSDFERKDGKKPTWWDWKDEKIALEGLLMTGELMIRKRHNFQRIYDLQERVLPDWDDARAPSMEAVHQTFVLNAVKALGVTKAAWIADYFRIHYKADAQAAFKAVMDAGQLETVKVEGRDVPGYVHPDQIKLVKTAQKKPPMSKTTLLSPFDPMVWDRTRAQELFNFTYQIECYTPAPKRIYGYFTLPILYKNQLIGRIDPKAHRKEGLFEVKALHLEPGVEVDDELIREVKAAIKACAEWHQTPQVVVRKATVPDLAGAVGD
jgi:uncharacterized protein